jgi:hypothetical protein
MVLQIPPALNWLQNDEHGREWLRELPSRVARCVEKWELRLGPPYQQSFVSIVFPVSKVQWSTTNTSRPPDGCGRPELFKMPRWHLSETPWVRHRILA